MSATGCPYEPHAFKKNFCLACKKPLSEHPNAKIDKEEPKKIIKRRSSTRRSFNFGGAPRCARCSKMAFPMESLTYDKIIYHKTCFSCIQCQSRLQMSAVAQYSGEIWCKNCFMTTFKARGGKYRGKDEVAAKWVSKSSKTPKAKPAPKKIKSLPEKTEPVAVKAERSKVKSAKLRQKFEVVAETHSLVKRNSVKICTVKGCYGDTVDGLTCRAHLEQHLPKKQKVELCSSQPEKIEEEIFRTEEQEVAFSKPENQGVDSSESVETNEEKKPMITVAYWTIRGLAAPLRNMVMYANAPLKSITYDTRPVQKEDGTLGWDSSSWFGVKPRLKKENPLINLPWIRVGDGPCVTQTNACLMAVGRALNMMGSNPTEQSHCEQLLCELQDIRNNMVRMAYGNSDKTSAEACLKSAARNFAKIELWLEAGGKSAPFLVGDSATAPDFHLYEMLCQYSALATLHEFDVPFGLRLVDFRVDFAALPQNARYLSSRLAELPFNNKMASFGATPDVGQTWTLDLDYDWDDLPQDF